MRELPEGFTQLEGVEPVFIVKIFDNYYSNKEFQITIGESVVQVYPFLVNVEGFSSITRDDGFAAANEIRITMLDYYGKFFDILKEENIYGSPVTLYVAVGIPEEQEPSNGGGWWVPVGGGNDPTDEENLFLLYKGKVRDGVEWIEEDKEIIFTVTNEVPQITLGFTPNVADISQGTLDPLDYKIITKNLTEETWPWLHREAKYYKAAKVINNPSATVAEDTIVDLGFLAWTIDEAGQVQDPDPHELELPIEEAPEDLLFPFDEEVDVEMFWRLNMEVAVRCKGTFINDDGQVVFKFMSDEMTAIYYSDISIEAVDINRFKILEPYPDDKLPWLQHMWLRLKHGSFPEEGDFLERSLVKCVKQDGDICEVRRGGIFTVSAWSDSYMEFLNNIYFEIEAAGKVDPRILFREVKQGAKIVKYDYSRSYAYVVSTDMITTVHEIKVDTIDGEQVIDPGLYEVKSTNGVDANRLWDGHPPCTFVLLNRDIIGRSFEEFSLGQRDQLGEEFLIHATNTAESIDKRLYSGFTKTGDVEDDDDFHKFVLLNEEAREDIFAEVMWQSGKYFRFRPDNEINFHTHFTDPLPMGTGEHGEIIFEFNDSNTLRSSLILGYTNREDITTRQYYNYQHFDLSNPIKERVRTINKDLYGLHEGTFDIYAVHGDAANVILQHYPNRLANMFHIVRLTGFLDSLGIEIFDPVQLSFSNIQFYDTSKGTPFSSIDALTTGSGELWNEWGWVVEINSRIMEGLIDYTIMIPIKAGDLVNE